MKFVLLNLLYLLTSCAGEQAEFSSGSFTLVIDGRGQVTRLADARSGKNYLASGQPAPFLSVRVDGKIHSPSSMEYHSDPGELVFRYDSAEITAQVRAEQNPSHLSFEVTGVEPADRVELVIWGPYPTTINKIIGETVGVVRGEEFALGLQTLNPKTLGGYPWNENDCMPQLDIFEGDDYSDLSEAGKRYVLYRVEAAKPEEFGSTLQAYCRNRFTDRVIENWDHERYIAPAFNDGGVIGSRIALFGCPVEDALDYIGRIEVEEGLPHPMIAGEWGKRSQAASSSYMILDFGEEDLEKALDYTKKAGLNYLYHSGPFETWGHFPLNNQFPSGWQGLKSCADKARERGIFLGVHILSNFITPNDAYMTPVPDTRLACVGSTTLTAVTGPAEKEMGIDDPALFQSMRNINLRTVMIGKELVQYEKVSDSNPWKLQGCERGAFGTIASSHEPGTDVALLADHGYKVFLSNADLTMEMAETIARLFNETGIRQVSFDGLEGNRSTGMGNYGEILMTSTWYDHLDEDIKTHYIADASRTSHYFWHIYSRMNWGEPWYAGFRESQAEYRFKNQAYFSRNLMPGMLGWFLMTETTSPEDIEWMLSKAAGYNAGFGFVCSYRSLEGNGKTQEILQLINRWETARMKQLFTSEVQEMLQSPDLEHQLEEDPDGTLTLWSATIARMAYLASTRQPGETDWTTLDYENIFDPQPLRFMVTVPDQTSIRGLEIAIDHVTVFRTEVELQAGTILCYGGDGEARIYSPTWKLLRTFPFEQPDLQIAKGGHKIAVKAETAGNSELPVKLEFKTIGNPIHIP